MGFRFRVQARGLIGVYRHCLSLAALTRGC